MTNNYSVRAILNKMNPQVSESQTIAQEMAIIEQLLDLPESKNITLVEEGWDSRVYLIDAIENARVFKFPRSKEVAESYRYEIAALKLASSIPLPVTVPVVKWEHPQNAYFGYVGVPGASVKSRVKDLSSSQKEQIGTVIGQFLRQLHKLKSSDAPRTTLQQELYVYQNDYILGLEKLKSAFSVSELKILQRFFFDTLPSIMVELGYEPVFSHGDLLLNNLLIDAQNQVGVIDFGDAGYYDQSKDFSGLWDDAIRAAALEAYGATTLLADKIGLRAQALPISSLAFYIGKQDPAGVERQLHNLRKTFLGD